jgi:hypothetical protein
VTEGGNGDVSETRGPGALDSGRVAWHIEQALQRLSGSNGPDSGVDLRRSASFVAWWATTMPLLFDHNLECELEGLVRTIEDSDDDATLFALPWLYAACTDLGLGDEPAARLTEGIAHHASVMRGAVNAALCLVVPALSFDDDRLRLPVEECIRRQYTDAEEAALLLLSAQGSPQDKRRWAASQLVRHVGHGSRLRLLLESAAAGSSLQNSLLATTAQGAVAALAPLITVAVPPGRRAGEHPSDWPKLDAIRLGGDLWPGLVLQRVLGLPFMQPTIEME